MKTSGVGHLLGLVHARETAVQLVSQTFAFFFLSRYIVCPLNQMRTTYTNTYRTYSFPMFTNIE